jgi:hypothetical protein
LCCCSSGDHPKVYGAKFGDIQNMKVEKLKHPFMSQAIAANLDFFFLKMFGDFFLKNAGDL